MTLSAAKRVAERETSVGDHPIPKLYALQRSLAWLLVCALMGCDVQTTQDTKQFQIASSSMAPGLRGPSTWARCRACSQAYWVAAETVNPGFRTRCFACGGLCDLAPEIIPGETVSVAFGAPKSLDRFDRVVFQTPLMPDVWQVKRIWGLPNETVRFHNGELWIDDIRIQKTLQQLRQVAIPVASLPDSQLVEANSEFEWQYRRPAPVAVNETPPEAWILASEIVDDFEYNQGLSQQLHIVDDFLVSFDLEEKLSTAIEIELRYQTRLITIHLHPPHEATQETQANRDAIACSKHATLALCDERLLIETDHTKRMVALNDLITGSDSTSDHATSESPPDQRRSSAPQVLIKTHLQSIVIQHFEVWRDQFLVPADGQSMEADFGTIPPAALFVLGDNLAASVDSRHGLGVVQLQQVVGIIRE